MNGKEFTEMRRRQEVADQQAKARLEKFQQKQAELEQAARNERRAKLEANKASLAMVTKNQLSWRELQEIEEAKRRDRIERRKQELAQVSALPSSIAENLQKSKREAAIAPASAASSGFKAEDPAKVDSFTHFREILLSCILTQNFRSAGGGKACASPEGVGAQDGAGARAHKGEVRPLKRHR
jgi:hypothetical protein